MVVPALSEELKTSFDFKTEDVVMQVDRVFAEDLYWFPVRHHSPMVAYHLKKILLKRKPEILFIECPSQANHLSAYLIDSKTKPPVAIYSSFRDDNNHFNLAGIVTGGADIPPVFPAWYPFLAYSPEYIAMKIAREIGARVTFIDLPHYARMKPFDPDEEVDDKDGEKEADPKSKKAEPGVIGSEHLMVESQFYQQLASAAGYRSFDEAWDSLFEMRHFEDSETFRREIATFCCASRMTAAPARIFLDGTVERERHMQQTLKRVLAETGAKPANAMVICGGFHLFLDREDETPAPVIPDGTIYNTIVPYSYFQVSQLSGYAAGTRAPQFYERVWDLSLASLQDDIVVEHVVDILNEVRSKGNMLSSADAIAVSQHAEMLSRLRGRTRPVLDDLHDALVTCCVKGDPQEEGTVLLNAIDAVDIGSRIGKVTADLGQLPVVMDFYANMEELSLAETLGKEKRLSLELDKRDPLAARRSIFLHRLNFLQVPLCGMADAPTGDFASGKIFLEKWLLKWSPAVESKLIDLNLYGDTIEAAALSRLRERLQEESDSAGATSALLVKAVDMDLPDLIRRTEDALSAAIDNDVRFVSLSRALTNLLVLDRYLVYRNLRRGLLDELVVRSFDRACFSILDVVNAPEEQQEAVVSALVALAEVTQQGDKQALDRNLFAENVRGAANLTIVPFLQGAFLGILAEIREMQPSELAARISALAKSPVEIMVTAGDLLDGIMAVSRTSIMLGADALIQAVDELLKAAEWEPFLLMLPKMRAAFERMHASHRHSFAARVAELYGLKEASALTELRITPEAAVTVARIDQRVAQIMKEWEF